MAEKEIIAIKGAGDLASGISIRLWRSGFRVIHSELPMPLCIRRTVAFANAVVDGETGVEDARAVLIHDPQEAFTVWAQRRIPIIVDESGRAILSLKPDVLIDARIIKTWRDDTNRGDAPLVIGLGPGFRAGENVDAVIETNRGHNLGRVLWQGEAEENTGVPGTIKGEGLKRVIKSPATGVFQPCVEIGDSVNEGDKIADVDGVPVITRLSGIVRGIIYPGITVEAGLKIMDIDPRGNREHCFSASDKANALGGAVLEAILARRE